ncbi:carboxypeptidase-like regulatory domain-containing protein [Ferruginibacter albus]|uniref:carboxypeptidase-like regulatory domain-containing protein n=1 Tax=Ferruginibacter albus TaxID=2875540 RepID=UPI001CC52328|nr:carboxypeptidase-like regulatory domain-containing protein [Ferruginibacter albus]UAY51317.1 carboxypeptidase-like regulatory domain-containing protein [Ferruginibacter albus]
MEARQETKLNMYHSVQKICDDNANVITTNPAFQTVYNSYKANISALITAISLESEVITGITIDKTEAKKALCRNATDVGAIIFAFASANNNNTLKQSVNFSYTDLFRLKDELVAPTIQNIYKAANDNAASLTDYGITAAMLTTFQSAIDAYNNSIAKPRTAKAIKGTHTQNIKELIKIIDNQLKEQLDKLIVNFRSSNSDFVSAYTNARIILDPAHSATQIKGTVTDADTKQPVAGVTVQLMGNIIQCITDAQGNFSLKPVIHGTHSVTISGNGYQSTTVNNIKVKLGQAVTVNATIKSS